jgi:hypothetical protein
LAITEFLLYQLTQVGQGGGSVLFESFAAVQVTVEIEMIVDRGVDRGEFLQRLYVPYFHRRPPVFGKAGVSFAPIFEQAPAFLIGDVAY